AGIERIREDALDGFALDLAPDQLRRAEPLPFGDEPGHQRRDRVPHTEAEDEAGQQAQQRKPREERMFEAMHPGGTRATRVPHAVVKRWGWPAAACVISRILVPVGWPASRHHRRDFVRPLQRRPRALVSANSTAPPAATSDAARA